MDEMQKIVLADIRTDGDTQPRAEINQAVCDEYVERMKAGEKFPPIDVFFDGEDYWLADGFHRIRAFRMAAPGEAIECNVFQGTLEDAQWHSYGVNRAHGLRRTNADKEKAVRAALAHPKCQGLSDAAVADHIGVRRETVLKYRHGQEVDLLKTNKSRPRTGRDGRTINTAAIGRKASETSDRQAVPSQSNGEAAIGGPCDDGSGTLPVAKTEDFDPLGSNTPTRERLDDTEATRLFQEFYTCLGATKKVVDRLDTGRPGPFYCRVMEALDLASDQARAWIHDEELDAQVHARRSAMAV